MSLKKVNLINVKACHHTFWSKLSQWDSAIRWPIIGFLHKNVNNKLIKKQNISLEKAKKKKMQNQKRIKP